MINEKKDLINTQINNINSKIKARDIIYLLIATGFASFGLVTTVLQLPLIGLPALATSIALGTGIYESRKRKNCVKERLLREKKHLDKVGKEGIDTSREISNKRVKKINELKKHKKRIESERKAGSMLNESLAFLCIATPLITISNPIIGLLVSSASAIAKIISEKVQTNETEHENIIINRINNLKNDLDLVRETYIDYVVNKKEDEEEKDKSTKKEKVEEKTVKDSKQSNIINIDTKINNKDEKVIQKVKKK